MTRNGTRDPEAFIKSEGVRAAHHLLLAELPKLGLTPSHNSGHVQAVRLHDVADRYLFSWIPNQHHLLFYVRKPALNAAANLRGSAVHRLPRTSENNAGEVTSRLETSQDAQAVLEWLQDILPLPD